LRILIDLQGAQNNSRYRGIGRYSLALAKGIARNAGTHRVFILLNGLFPETIEPIRSSFSGILGERQFLIFTTPGPVAELRGGSIWRRLTAELLREYTIDTFSPDVLLITSMIEGAQDDTVTSVAKLSPSVPAAAVIYDLIPLTNPESYGNDELSKRWYRSKLDSLRQVDLLLSISQATMDEAIELLNIEPNRITNISAAAEDCFLSANVSEAQSSVILKRHGVNRKFLMHASAFETRKNFQGLIKSYGALPRGIRADYQLVLVCKLDPRERDDLMGLAKNVGLASGEIVLTGFLPDDDLIALYAACHLFVFPSFQEGFGLPALEAMCCGTATIGSNTTSIPEVIGREDALFDPTSVENMTAVIRKSLTDASFYNTLKNHAKEQAARFSWNKTAMRAIGSMEKLVFSSDRGASPQVNSIAKRRILLNAVADVSMDFSPDDSEILELARCIDSNDSAVRHVMSPSV
jgi:glycosyltransferase involved in cell wall biosynthesis